MTNLDIIEERYAPGQHQAIRDDLMLEDLRYLLDAFHAMERDLKREVQNREAAHKILTSAGVASAAGAACDDPNCISRLTHRVHDLVDQRDDLEAKLQRVLDWAHHYGNDLCPGTAADTYGEGQRAAKGRVLRLIDKRGAL